MKRTMTKWITAVFAAVLSCQVVGADGAAGAVPRSASGPEKLTVGVFVDDGARSNGWASWLRLLHTSPQVTPVLLDGASVRNGALTNSNIDVFVMPGGNSLNEGNALQAKGRAALKTWIAGGGLYFGTCAGCSFLLQNNLLKLLPYTRHPNNPSGGADLLWTTVTERGEELTGIKAGRHPMRYHGGPLLVATNAVEGTDVEVIGTWLQDYRSGNPSPSMVGYPSLLCGTHGQGKLFLTTGHPEHFLRSRDFIVGGFRYLTGVELTFTPQPRPRSAKTVGFYTPCVASIADAELFLTLDSNPSTVVIPLQDDDITGGALDRIDKLVLPAGSSSGYSEHMETIQPYIDAFTARGGELDDRRQ